MNRAGAALLVVAIGASARADDSARGGGFLGELATDVQTKLDAASRARTPPPVAPKPIAVRWKPFKIDSIDLGAPLVALAAADLDGDKHGELYAVTSRDVVAIGFAGGRARELGRVAFTGDLAVPGPRDVVGVATVDGSSIEASVSTYARGMRVSWHGKTLVADPEGPGFPLCPGERAPLVPGRNYFGDPPIYAVRCREVVDQKGNPLRVRASLAITGKLDVTVESCADVKCEPIAHHSIANVGVAFDIGDIDQDGNPELIYAANVAPGDSDVVKVVTLGAGNPQLKRAFNAGIAGVAAIDLDGNGTLEVVVAVRLVGATRVDLWRLD